MGIESILVHIGDDTAQREQRLDLAFALADQHEAHLAALYVIEFPPLPFYGPAEVSGEWIQRFYDEGRERAAAAEAWFNEATARAGIAAEWRSVQGAADETIATHARYSDLVLLSQVDPEAEGAPGFRLLMEGVVMDSGRPALIVPYIGAHGGSFPHVLVAWNATRESTRAINDAMPLLQAADRVTVLSVNPEEGPEAHGELPSSDIALHLARHGVKAEAAQSFARDIDVGDAILSRAADLGADLLVMGAYGHSRLRETVFGGATRHILEHMTIPVLMSH